MGGYYYHIRDGEQKARIGPGRGLIGDRPSPQDADWDSIRREVMERIGEEVDSITGGDFTLTPLECPDYCNFRAVCRHQR